MGAMSHEGDEASYVLEGRVELFIDSATLDMNTGDSFAFASYLFHNCRNPGKDVSPVLWINKLPTF